VILEVIFYTSSFISESILPWLGKYLRQECKLNQAEKLERKNDYMSVE
jgi:hypothetical protein